MQKKVLLPGILHIITKDFQMFLQHQKINILHFLNKNTVLLRMETVLCSCNVVYRS